MSSLTTSLVPHAMNHRARLWSASTARATLLPLLPQIDVLFASVDEAALLLGHEPTVPGDACSALRELGPRTVVPRTAPPARGGRTDAPGDFDRPPRPSLSTRSVPGTCSSPDSSVRGSRTPTTKRPAISPHIPLRSPSPRRVIGKASRIRRLRRPSNSLTPLDP